MTGELAQEKDSGAYLVGGPVRDLLLGKPGQDIDIVIDSGKVKEIIREFIHKTGGKKSREIKEVKYHAEFGTATVVFKNFHLDFAAARSETYGRPGALPKVKKAGINEDLKRRDFTINAMAMCINPDKYGIILDLFGGCGDLETKTLRVLHDSSFIDDPTRLFRAARFGSRLGFTPDRKTLGLIKEAVSGEAVLAVSMERIREELYAILHEEKPGGSFEIMEKWGLLKYFYPRAGLEPGIISQLDRSIPAEKALEVRLALLFYRFDLPELKKALKALKLERVLFNEIYDTVRYMSGERVPEIPGWSKQFFGIIGFEKREMLLGGNDLIRMGFAPGAIFKEIFSDLFRRKELKNKKEAKEFVLKKYGNRKNRC